MHHREATTRTKSTRRGAVKAGIIPQSKTELRYTVSLPAALAQQVELYAETVETSMSRAIAALVRRGLESQESRKREFFKKLKQNLANDDPKEEDRLVDEFRNLILGR
jgi:hypothetical protein